MSDEIVVNKEEIKIIDDTPKKIKQRGPTSGWKQRDLTIIDLFLRGMRKSEIAQLLKLKEGKVNKVIKKFIETSKKEFAGIKKDPTTEITILVNKFDMMVRTAMQSYSSATGTAVKEKFLSAALKGMLCKVKLMMDVGLIPIGQGNLFKALDEEIDKAAGLLLSSQSKDKLRKILQRNIVGDRIKDVEPILPTNGS